MNYTNMASCEPRAEKSAPTVSRTIGEQVDNNLKMTAEQLMFVRRLIGAINGGELPPTPEQETAGIVGMLKQLTDMNSGLLSALQVLCEMVGA